MDKNNSTRYKTSDAEVKKYREFYEYLIDFTTNFFDKFKVFLGEPNKSDGENLRNSIVSETKSLAMSRVSTGSPLEFYDLTKSRATSSSEPVLQRV